MRSKIYLFVFVYSILIVSSALAQKHHSRKEFDLPEIDGYITLKADLHIHTVFSDGLVWPTVRVEEAWREGYDVIAITDHIEYQPHKKDVNVDHNRSFEIAEKEAENFGIIVIRGGEITRSMPPGHFNAIFLNDVNALDTESYMDAFNAAKSQNAFIFWNHPGWRQKDEIPIWLDEHTYLYENGFMNGIEVVNERSYYPLAQRWAIDKNLTLMGNSDIHNTSGLFYDHAQRDHKVATIVFAKERNLAGVREALDAHRTIVYHEKYLIGDEQFLRPIFEKSISIVDPSLDFSNSATAYVQVNNTSDIDYELRFDSSDNSIISLPDEIILYARRTTRFAIVKRKGAVINGNLELSFNIENLFVEPEKGLKSKFSFSVK